LSFQTKKAAAAAELNGNEVKNGDENGKEPHDEEVEGEDDDEDEEETGDQAPEATEAEANGKVRVF
jgi:hypothetical protein